MRWSLLLFAACNPLPPPPVLPTYAFAAPDARGTTTAMLVFGFATEPLGGGGMGMAFRVEHQDTIHTTLGLELTGGVGDSVAYGKADRSTLYLLGVRAYGRTGTENVDATYGVGLAFMSNGSLTAQLHGGGLFGGQNDTAGSTIQFAAALCLPLLHGRPFGAVPFGISPRASDQPTLVPLHTELYLSLDVAGLVHAGDGNRFAIDVGVAHPMIFDKDNLLTTSIADAVH